MRNIAQVTTAVAQGDLTKKIDVDARGEILELKTTINTMVDQLSSFAAEVTRVAREVGREGKLGGQAEVEGVSGTWKRLTENVNELAGNLTRQVRAISQVTSAVAAGDLTRTISVDAEGEVAELKDTINTMVDTLRETVQASRDQDWLKTNLASIGSMMQGHRDLEVVAELIMEELAPLMGAQHGTFFLAEQAGDETRLRLIAGYGLRADKDAPMQYRIGQSLIGQVAKSKRLVVVDEIPQGYIKITSGLGEAPPANLVVFPLLFEGEVLGVVELASFSKFTPIQIDFLEQFAETLGISVNAIIANSRTDTLLDQSQQLATELQARSSELQARSEELQRSNADLEDKAELLAAQKQDIEAKNSEIERARAEIEERARQLALASQYKSQFLANMSHELRTPLNSLLILARLLAQNPGRNLTGKQVEYANVIHSAGSDLLQLINDILDLSKVEAGRMDLHAERFTLAALIEDLQATFQPLTTEKGLDFEVAIEPSALSELDTDRQRLRQVVGNLLSNAVKFTERGRVTLRVSATPAADGQGGDPELVFSVVDTGIGIAPENLAVIFGAFQQGDGTLSRRYGGTGLGLVDRQPGQRAARRPDHRHQRPRPRQHVHPAGARHAARLPALRRGRRRLRRPGRGLADAGRADRVRRAGPTAAAPVRPAGPPGDPGRPAPGRTRSASRCGPRWRTSPAPRARSSRPGQADVTTTPFLSPSSRARLTGTAATVSAIAGPSGGDEGGVGQDRNVLVFEGTSGGLLTLLAYSAISDLAGVSTAVRVSTAVGPSQGVAMLAAEPFRCVVVDLAMPTALEFLEQVQEKPELREVPVLAYQSAQPDSASAGPLRGAALRVSDAGAAALAGRAPRADHAAPVGRPAGAGARVRRQLGRRDREREASGRARPGRAPRPAGQARARHRRRRSQRLRDHQLARTARHRGDARKRRAAGHRGAACQPGDRPDPDRHHDAGDGRLRDDDRDPADARVRVAADHRGHRAGDAQRPGEEPGGRRQRLRDQAGRHRRADGLHGTVAGERLRPAPGDEKPAGALGGSW